MQSKLNYLNLLSQPLLCEKNPKIIQKIIYDIFIFIKLLNVKKILNTSKNSNSNNNIKQQLFNILKNIEIAIILNVCQECKKIKFQSF